MFLLECGTKWYQNIHNGNVSVLNNGLILKENIIIDSYGAYGELINITIAIWKSKVFLYETDAIVCTDISCYW